MTGKMTFDNEDYHYPKPLIEVLGKTILERSLEPLKNITIPKQFIALIRSADVQSFNFDYVIKQVIEDQLNLIILENQTQGALCTALLAIESIQNDDPLIISSVDHVIDANINAALDEFNRDNCDAGAICFNSVHPKWSFVRKDAFGNVVETAEKRPISSNAIAGFYYFRHGKEFVEAAKNVIRKGAITQGAYYISPTFNELILQGKRIGIHEIPNNRYHNFYDPSSVKAFEAYLENASLEESATLNAECDQYQQAMLNKELHILQNIFPEDIILRDSLDGSKEGRKEVLKSFAQLFESLSNAVDIRVLKKIKERNCVVLEFACQKAQDQTHLLFILIFKNKKISEINSFIKVDKQI